MSTISIQNISNGTALDATPVENNFVAIANVINGGIDTTNFTANNTDLSTIAKATPWIQDSSTISGFSGTPTQANRYQVLGKTLIYKFDMTGNSNSTALTFTIPFNTKEATRYGGYFVTDNTVDQTTPGAIATAAGGSTISTFKDMTGTAWTNTGAKGIRGVLICELA